MSAETGKLITHARASCQFVAALLLLAAAACERADRYDAHGLVLKVDREQGIVTVSHDPIPGFMDAMVMPLAVRHRVGLRDLRPGDRIGFRLNVGDERTVIDRILVISGGSSVVTFSASAGEPVAPAAAPVAVGDPVPDFTLVDHHERPVSLQSLRGSIVAIAFVYTRCPLPDYCPRVITNLTALRNRFGALLGRDLVLLTVTFDPGHDTPAVLREFAESYGADVPGWHFLTGRLDEVRGVCRLFGVESWPEEGLITHTLQTALIDRAGRLAAIVPGLDVSPRALGDLVEHTIAGR